MQPGYHVLPGFKSKVLLEQRPNCIVEEQLAGADVSCEHAVAGMARLRPDLEHRHPRLRGARGEAGSKGMTAVTGWIDAVGGDPFLDDQRYGLSR